MLPRFCLPGCWRRCFLLRGALLAALWLLAGSGAARAQPGAFRLREGHRSAHLPFWLERNLIVVPVMLNGRGPYNFMLDTGVGMPLITDPTLRDTLGLRLGTQFLVAGVGEEAPLLAFQTDSLRVSLGQGRVQAPGLPFLWLSTDVFDLSAYVGMPIHGILGADFFRSFVVGINTESRQLKLTAPARYRKPRGRRWANLPLSLEGDKAYLSVPVTLSDSVQMAVKLILDTGAGHALSLETGSDARITLPEPHLRSRLGRGLSGDVHGYLGRVPALRLGQYRLSRLLASFPDEESVRARVTVPRNGNIGFELLKRFRVVVDYPHNRLLLRPNILFRDPFEHDMCGVELLATGPSYRNYLITAVEPHSPAAEAQLQAGDELLSINFVPTHQMSLTQISRLLHSADGRQLIFVLLRGGETVVAQVKLKRQI